MEAVAASSDVASTATTTSILLVAPPASGGLAHHVISLLAGLHGEGYRVGVACEAKGRIGEAARERSVSLYEVRCTAAAGPSRAAVRAIWLARAIGALRPQVVHAHSFGASFIGALACRIAGSAPLLVTIHNYLPRGQGMRPRRARERWALGVALRRASRVITVSEALRRDLLAVWPDVAAKCVTIPNGVDIRALPKTSPSEVREYLGIPPAGPLVGAIARLAPQKGVLEFIRAARAAADDCASAHFVLAGDGPLREEARSLQRELGLEDRLHLVGEVEPARDLIAAFDLVIIPSISEGSSIVGMEAMALGKPVVGTAVGGVPEVVSDGETGLLVGPGDAGVLARAITEMLRDPERAQEMGRRARERAAADFDVRLMLERTKAVYADLVRERMETEGKRR